MAVRQIERELERLSELRSSQSPLVRDQALRKGLADRVNVIVAKAAALAAEMGVRTLIPDLCAAFDRLLLNAASSDPACRGKEAIAKALKDLEHDDSTIFRKGVQHVQMEPVWGGEEDTACTLRGTCLLALIACSDLTREDKLWAVVPLVTDRSPAVRKDAAVALESLEGREAALLLRLKARMGDMDATVTGRVFEAVLQVENAGAVPFVAEFLRAPQLETREEAALALGASRLASAVKVLTDMLAQKQYLLDYEILCRALGISRHPEAAEFLLRMVRTERPREAIAALEALALYRNSGDIFARLSEAVADRGETEIEEEFQRLFPGG